MYSQLFLVLGKKLRLIFLAGLVFAVVALLVSFIFPLQYRADAQVLIISKSRYGVDPYTIAKSAERVAGDLVAVMKTNDFFSKVMSQPNYNIDKSRYENVDELTKRQHWQADVNATVVYGTGVLNVSAFGKNQDLAMQLTSAVVNTLSAHGFEYLGDDVTIKLVNDAVATRFIAKPNLILNTLIGFIIGVILMMLVIVRRYRV